MSTAIIKDNSILAVEEESTEGTFVAPSGATSYFQPLADGWDITPLRPNLERQVLTASVGKATPRKGIKSVTAQMPVELRASGTEGAAPDFDYFLKCALGATRAISSQTTTKSSGNSGSSLKIEDADISKFNVGDIICVLQSGGYHFAAVTAVDSTGGAAAITISPAKASGSFANSVVISKSKMYYPANSGHASLSVSAYLANEKRLAAIGCKVASMSIDNFSAGGLASINFGLEGMNWSIADGAAPHTPTYDSGVPPTILNACLYMSGTEYKINTFGLNLANVIGWLTSTCSSTGRDKGRVTDRTVTGTINPLMDDTTTTLEDLLNSGDEFSLFISAAIPSATAGQFTLGSAVGIYLPKCMVNEEKVGDLEGILTNDISFGAYRGSDGTTEEIYMGFI